jgi:TonB family protein
MATTLTLKVVRDGEVVATHTVEGELIKIGRMASAHLRLDDPKVSRIHAMLEVGADGTVSVIDMGSAQGTLVDGKPISKVALSSGDRFVVGDTTVEVVFGASAAKAPAAPEPAPVEAARPAEPEAKPEPEPEPVAAAVETRDPEPAPRVAEPTPPREAVKPASPARTTRREPSSRPRSAAKGDLALPAPWPQEAMGRPMALHVGIFWGDQPLETGAFFDATEVTIGGTKASFFVDPGDLPRDPFPIARQEGGSWTITIPEGAKGGVLRDGTLHSFDELRGRMRAGEGGLEFPLGVSESAYVEMGNIRLTYCFRPKRKPILVEWTQTLDYSYLNALAVSFFLVAASVVGFLHTEPAPPMTADDLFANQARFTRLLLQPPERIAQNPFLQRLEKLKEPAGAKTVRAPGEEGKMGRRDAPQVERRTAPQGNPNDKEIVSNQGILSILGKGSAGLSAVLGSSGLGGELKGAIGGLTGNAVGDAHGFGGLGLRGTGPGGGAIGETVSVGAIGTRGRGGGAAGFGSGVGGLGKKGSAEVKIDTSAVSITGTIDRELIRRVIHANHGKFKYCYENELVRNPRLAGRIAVRFQINAQGAVTFASVDHSTMGNAAVENCVVARIRGLTFPMPQGGGAALVTYPFVFNPPGE